MCRVVVIVLIACALAHAAKPRLCAEDYRFLHEAFVTVSMFRSPEQRDRILAYKNSRAPRARRVALGGYGEHLGDRRTTESGAAHPMAFVRTIEPTQGLMSAFVGNVPPAGQPYHVAKVESFYRNARGHVE